MCARASVCRCDKLRCGVRTGMCVWGWGGGGESGGSVPSHRAQWATNMQSIPRVNLVLLT